MRKVAAGLALALMLGGCAHSMAPTATSLAPAGLSARSDEPPLLELKPEQALEKATKKAREWNADARLVSVFWGVAKFQTTSVVVHLFHSPKASKLFSVESKLTTWGQATREITDRKYTWPAKLLGTLESYPVSAPEVLETAKKHLPNGEKHPVAGLVLVKPNALTPALWMVRADEAKLLVHAKSGKVIVHTIKDIPLLPFI